jgi:hypothetical protein
MIGIEVDIAQRVGRGGDDFGQAQRGNQAAAARTA